MLTRRLVFLRILLRLLCFLTLHNYFKRVTCATHNGFVIIGLSVYSEIHTINDKPKVYYCVCAICAYQPEN